MKWVPSQIPTPYISTFLEQGGLFQDTHPLLNYSTVAYLAYAKRCFFNEHQNVSVKFRLLFTIVAKINQLSVR